MQHRVEVIHKEDCKDPAGLSALADVRDLGIRSVRDVRAVDVFLVDGELEPAQVRALTEALLLDPVVQRYRVCGPGQEPWPWAEDGDVHSIEVKRRPGVMDPVQQSAMKGAADLGLGDRVSAIRTARRYLIRGGLSRQELERIAWKALANDTIEEVHIDQPEVAYPLHEVQYEFELLHVPIREAGDAELMRISVEGVLSLSLEEMKTIQAHYRELGREPTDIELEILAQTWSEHCVHKTLKGHITYEGPVPPGWEDNVDADGRLVLDNLLGRTVARATAELDKPWCVSVFEDNAGVIEFDGESCVCFKVETHNHPSAIEPYGGANTGIGGVIRDPLGTGLGARPIMNTDVFCFGPPDMAEDDVPRGALHPRRVMKGVVAGVRDYGNRMGIPTANGAVYFDPRYTGNPLVYCGNIGIIPRDYVRKAAQPDDLIVVVGGRTGRDGIHGATFSSVELTSESEEVSGGAVQIGNPITEKKVLDTLLKARDAGLYTAITDCGAGGLSCAVGEMGERTGADAEIRDVPLKYQGLSYTEVWISEAQERMVLSVPPEDLDELLATFEGEDVEATVIGTFTDDGVLRVKYDGNTVAELDMEFVHHGLPRFRGTARWEPPGFPDPLVQDTQQHASPEQRGACRAALEGPDDYAEALRRILAAPNVRSKEWIIRQYDHEVQGQTVVKPLVGPQADGPGDASVITPVLGSARGIAVGCGLNPKYGDIDAYHSAASAIDEALRNITAVGAPIARAAILDNFCWGNTRRPEQLGTLVRAALACYDCAVGFGVPFISGKDSLNNEFNTGEETIAIPPTLLISAMAVMDDVRRAVTMDLKEPGNLLYLVGSTRPELGGSHYLGLFGLTGVTVPRVRVESARLTMEALSGAIADGLVRACHDLSEGGLGVAAAEMAFAGGVGLSVDLRRVPYEGPAEQRRDAVLLFAESNSRFLAEVPPDRADAFEERFAGLVAAAIGRTAASAALQVIGMDGTPLLEAELPSLKAAWQTPLV
ncbi:MAG: phosphoribosylformylglycinamidine synthase [Planctomycetes bacterium SM23_32]|nr:MAG: phosphoribosylformylglycinamidine synthase [Planctomycetes bacterium SM23_32]